MERVIFLDRDGTINVEVNYLYRPEDLILLPQTAQAIRCLKEAGYKIVVVTNQAGIARGYYQEQDVIHLHEYLNQQLAKEGAKIDAFFYCPHHPQKGLGQYHQVCQCRKPGIGMFLQAEALFSIDREHSYMIGDKMIDIEAGHRYGVTGILVGTGYGAAFRQEVMEKGEQASYEYFAENLMDAARYITTK